MTTTWVPGYLGTITISGDDWSVVANAYDLSGAKTVPRKATFGAAASGVVSGQKSWTFSVNGHIAKEEPLAKLIAAFNSTTPLTFELQVGQAAGATDAGKFAGNLVFDGLSITGDPEGEHDWSATCQVDGDVTFTPPA